MSDRPMIEITDAAEGPDYVTVTMQGQEPIVTPNEPKFVADVIRDLNAKADRG